MTAFLDSFRDFLWGAPMLVLLCGAGLFLSARFRFSTITRLGSMLRLTFGELRSTRATNGVSPFQAVSMALASTVGIGNVAGVATAMTAGGPGAIFWMWVAAFVGMATKYTEIILALRFREKDADGNWVGGPMITIKNGMGSKWTPLAVTFAVLCLTATLGVGNTVQVNTMAALGRELFGLPSYVLGLIIVLPAAVILMGGVRSVSRVTEMLVPLMSLLFIASALIVVLINANQIPQALSQICLGAFGLKPALGGAAGAGVSAAVRFGVSRGMFSNEAGLGSAPIAHATAEAEHPVRQGMWGAAEVFIDTILMCTLTALAILCSGAFRPELSGIEMSMAAFSSAFGVYGQYILTISIALFGFSSIIGWALYGEQCCRFLSKKPAVIRLYQAAFLIIAFISAGWSASFVWSLADILNGLMAIPNLICIIALSGEAVRLHRQYWH